MTGHAIAVAMLATLLLAGLPSTSEPKGQTADQQRCDQYGDPLPAGAIARLGTLRFRHPSWVTGLAYAPDGRILASACADGSVRLWDAGSGKSINVLRPANPPPGQMFSGVAINQGKLIAVANGDFAHVWDLQSGNKLLELKGGNGFSLAVSKDGRMLAKGLGGDGKKQVSLWDLQEGKLLREFGATDRIAGAVAFAPDGEIIASGDSAPMETRKNEKESFSSLRLWNAITGKQLQELKGHKGGITSVAFSQDGKLLASASHDATIRLWNPVSGKALRTIIVPDDSSELPYAFEQKKGVQYGGVDALAFSPDGILLASGGHDGTIRIWEPGSGKELHVIPGHDREVIALSFSPDARILASGSRDHTIRLWDPSTAKEVQPREGHNGRVHSVAVSSDLRFVAATASDRKIRLWSLNTGKQLRVMQGHTSDVFSVVFSPDNRMVASAGDDKTVRIWDISTGRELRRIVGHARPVDSVAFTPGGEVLISGSRDGTVRFWDWRGRKELRQVKGDGSPCLSISCDGRMVGTGGKQAKLWNIETAKLFTMPAGPAWKRTGCLGAARSSSSLVGNRASRSRVGKTKRSTIHSPSGVRAAFLAM